RADGPWASWTEATASHTSLSTQVDAKGLVIAVDRVFGTHMVATTDRVLIILSAVGSLTWNTETVSAFLLVGVGILWMILSIRLLPPSGKEVIRGT
ncbi:MAG: hypothetical protein LC808_43030, partial [Actinobacteria bacterium]|nr:hypothetical protein [Actinomycetota bacterium]